MGELTAFGALVVVGSASGMQQGSELGTPGLTGGGGQGTTGQPAGTPQTSPPPGGGGANLFLILIPMLIVMMLLTSMAGRKERKKKKQLLDNLHKQDRIQTIGGLIGTVTDIQGDEVLVRMEEGKVRISKSAVQQVIKSARSSDGANQTVESKETNREAEPAAV